MRSSMRLASPRQQSKYKKFPLTPRQCRQVVESQKTSLGEANTNELIEKYTNPTNLPSTKSISHRLQGGITHHLRRDLAVSSAHSDTGGRRNPGRNDGGTWNGGSFINARQIDITSDYYNLDSDAEFYPICEEEYEQAAQIRRPRTTEISFGDIPMKVKKPKKPKVSGYQIVSPISRVTSVPPSESGEAPLPAEDESMSDWDLASCGSPAQEWVDVEYSDTPECESNQDLTLPPVAPKVSNPPRLTYAQVLGEQPVEAQK